MANRVFAYCCFLMIFLGSFSIPAFSKELVCGISGGYPPYQFKEKNKTTGFDADLLRMVFKKMEQKLVFFQADWDDVVHSLKVGRIDCIVGMEINHFRSNYFSFTRDYYYRKNLIFIREDNSEISRIEDLQRKFVTGDRHSSVENYLKQKGLKRKIRIKQTKSKEISMRLLKEQKSQAAIMPKAVGFYLAEKMRLKVKVLKIPTPGTPVAIAVKKGNLKLLTSFNKALTELIKNGEVEKLYQKWFK